ncbi:hypothetical protein PRIPAC_76020, partial [Pristionchus pacificus]|uniref:Uncharacterized protein n=1 Tax=Pristionchus pacificus TaxID=54126 RepID=A0A2A6CSF8_PRIPA
RSSRRKRERDLIGNPNSKRFFRFASDRLKDHSVPIPPLIDATGSHFVSDQSKADHISKHFSKCFNHQTYPIPAQPPPIAGPTIDFVPFSPMIMNLPSLYERRTRIDLLTS